MFTKGSNYNEPKSINWKHNFNILMDSVEDCARQWAKREKEDLDTLSEWVENVRSLMQIIIIKINGSQSTHTTSILKDLMLLNTCLTSMTNMTFAPADKAPNSICFVCKSHYIDCLVKGLGIDSSLCNPTHTSLTRKNRSWTIIGLLYVPLEFQPKTKNCIHRYSTWFLNYTNVLTNNVILPYKQRYIAWSAKCFTKPHSKWLTSILSAVKTGFQKKSYFVKNHRFYHKVFWNLYHQNARFFLLTTYWLRYV